MDTSRPIIVVGCPGSGTSMLRSMLHGHPRIAVPTETGFVLDAYENRRSFGDLSDPCRREALGRWIGADRLAALRLDPQATIEHITAGPATLGGALGIALRAYAARLGKPRWGAQVPDLDVALRLFPDAQIVTLVRDGRDCVAALKQTSGLSAAAATWARAVDDARRAAGRLRRDQWLKLRYEDLVADAPGELIRLCSFLGESYDPAMALPVRLARTPGQRTWPAPDRHSPPTISQPLTGELSTGRKPVTGELSTGRKPVTGELSTGRKPITGDPLTANEVALCEAILGSRLTRHGYKLSGAGRPRGADLLRFSLTAIPRRLARLRPAY